jgi:poly-gamma-glutamate system protein
MERTLADSALIHGRSLLVSLGGNNDVGAGLPEEGRNILREAIRRNGYRLLEVLPLQKSIDGKYATLKRAAKGKIKAFINVGGGVASLGSHEVGELLRPGINWPRTYVDLSLEDYPVEGLVAKFLKEGVPVIHLLHVRTLAKRYGLPLVVAAMPDVGEGRLFFVQRYVLWVQAALLVSYLLLVFLVVNGYLGKFFGNPRKEEETV